MNQIKDEFSVLFEEENKEEAVVYVLNKLKSNEIDVIDLYTYILTPLLNHLTCKLEDKRICIWKEHVKTAIVRTIVECCYPYVLEKRNLLNSSKKGTAVILCPPGEHHDLGARMASDFFMINGYDTIFVGSSIPYEDFYNAIEIIKPTLVAISVSNYYNLVATKRMIQEIKQTTNYSMKIIVGGHAFQEAPENKVKAVGADFYVKSYEDILKLNDNEVTL